MWNSSAVIYPTLQLHWLEVITGTSWLSYETHHMWQSLLRPTTHPWTRGGSYSPHTRYYVSMLETTRQTCRIPSHTQQPSQYVRGSKNYGSLSSKYHVWGHWRNIPRIIWCHDMDVLQQQTSKWIKEPSNNPLTHHIQSICSSILLVMGYNMPVRQTHIYICNKLYKWPIMQWDLLESTHMLVKTGVGSQQRKRHGQISNYFSR